MYSHTIVVYFYIRIPKNLVNVGSSRHKLPRHRKNCVGDTDPSGQNWSDTVCRRRHVATCRRLFQLSRREGRNVQRVVRVHVPKTATATAHARNRLGRRSGDRQTYGGARPAEPPGTEKGQPPIEEQERRPQPPEGGQERPESRPGPCSEDGDCDGSCAKPSRQEVG